MLTYTLEVCGVIGVTLLCLAVPVTAIGLAIGWLRSALIARRNGPHAARRLGRPVRLATDP